MKTQNGHNFTQEMIDELAVAVTRNEAGRHFTEWANWEALEDAGLITINRPPQGTMTDWTLWITDEGQDLVDVLHEGN